MKVAVKTRSGETVIVGQYAQQAGAEKEAELVTLRGVTYVKDGFLRVLPASEIAEAWTEAN